ncbi:MAG: aldo/keto reductase [Shimia sp.]
MKRIPLGRSGIDVSILCLGSMTWGSQNSEAEAHAQIDRALDRGCDFLDTAEMYPTTPLKPETVGRTEELIGTWNAKGRRKDIILATKHSGEGFAHGKAGGAPISPDTIRATLEGNLKRLQTDYIDLYQFHWPNRGSYMFRQNWTYDPRKQPSRAEVLQDMADCMGALGREVERGTIRTFGMSNESAWGMAQLIALAEGGTGPRPVALQNEYSLLCRLYDTDLAELAHHEDILLLAFSPLATGLLTGKYQGGKVPEGSRMSIGPQLGGRVTDDNRERVLAAVEAYLGIARRHGLDPTQMALAWCLTRPFPVSPIFGATSMEQLDTALGAADVTLSDEVLAEIDTAHRAHPMPY